MSKTWAIVIEDRERRGKRGGKTAVLRALHQLAEFDPVTRTYKTPIVTEAEIRRVRSTIKTGSAAYHAYNFLVDLQRKDPIRIWPPELRDLGIFAFPTSGPCGEGHCFEWAVVGANATQAQFDLFFGNIVPTDDTPVRPISVLGLPLEFREMGRKSEACLIRAVRDAKLLEAHFGCYTDGQQVEVRELTHLYDNVKLGKTEIDSLYFLRLVDSRAGYVTVEAKQGDRIVAGQIVRQVRRAFTLPSVSPISIVVPLALKAVADGGVHLVEFQVVTRDQAGVLRGLDIARNAVYRLMPTMIMDADEDDDEDASGT